jgi:hypothetical protein
VVRIIYDAANVIYLLFFLTPVLSISWRGRSEASESLKSFCSLGDYLPLRKAERGWVR